MDLATTPPTVGPPVWVWLMLVAAAAIATVTDIRETRIPNWLTLPLMFFGLVAGPIFGGWWGLSDALLGMAVAGGLFVWAYAFYGGGAGDAKMMMGVGLWLGYQAAFVVTVAVTLVGFILAMVGVGVRGQVRDIPIVIITGWIRTMQSVRRVFTAQVIERSEEELAAATVKGRDRPKGWIPFAPAILGGILLGWWYLETQGSIL